jgi:UDP-N-acetylglucosamine acyltransferase
VVDIHPTAVVSEKAELGENVKIGPYSVINGHVVIGDDTEIAAHVLIDSHTTIGKRNRIFTGAVIGSESQDLKFTGEVSYVKIGDDNILREYVTVNRATEPGGTTVIGNHNAILAYCHVAHDCILGNRITISNVTTLAGHVQVEDQAGLGGYVGVHQFVKIGSMAYVGGWSKVVKDVPPFVRVSGTPLRVYGLNSVGLERKEVPPDSRRALRKAYTLLFRSNHNVSQALELIEKEVPQVKEVADLLRFVSTSERGITRN